MRVMSAPIVAPSTVVPDLPADLDAIVLKGLSRDRDQRFATTEEMAPRARGDLPPARPAEIGKWVGKTAGDALAVRAKRIAEIESQSSDLSTEVALGYSTALGSSARRSDSGHGSLGGGAGILARTNAQALRRRGAAGAIVVVAGIGVAFLFTRSTPGASTASAGSASAAASAPASPASPPSASHVPIASAVPAACRIAPPPSRAPVLPAPAAPRRPLPPRAAPSPPPGRIAILPTSSDQAGVKHFKKGCL